MIGLIDRLRTIPESVRGRKYITDTDDFFRNRDGLRVLRQMIVPDGTPAYSTPDSFEYVVGQGKMRLRVYPDDGVIQGHLERAGQSDRHLVGGVIFERNRKFQQVTFVHPDARLVGFSGVVITRTRRGVVDLGDLNTFGPPAEQRIADLREANRLAVRQNNRRVHAGRK